MPQTLCALPPEHGVRLITLQRPEALNALNTQLLGELAAELDAAEQDADPRVVVITGSRRAFAAGADIKEMAERDLVGILEDPRLAHWQRITRFSKPIIAAVNGFALGGGCELALMCDFILAGDNAKFGQPEINLGVLPGMGGTQRLTRAVGKSLAMQMVLTGEPINARRALDAGLVSGSPPGADRRAPSPWPARSPRRRRWPCAWPRKPCSRPRTPIWPAACASSAMPSPCGRHQDRNEGIRAFQEKRRPCYKGR